MRICERLLDANLTSFSTASLSPSKALGQRWNLTNRLGAHSTCRRGCHREHRMELTKLMSQAGLQPHGATMG
eukprot:1335670-Pyramimonas_sp.AAC.1